jgi:hypothetical protein
MSFSTSFNFCPVPSHYTCFHKENDPVLSSFQQLKDIAIVSPLKIFLRIFSGGFPYVLKLLR